MLNVELLTVPEATKEPTQLNSSYRLFAPYVRVVVMTIGPSLGLGYALISSVSNSGIPTVLWSE